MIYIQPSDDDIQLNYSIKLSKDIDKKKELAIIPIPSNSFNQKEVSKIIFLN